MKNTHGKYAENNKKVKYELALIEKINFYYELQIGEGNEKLYTLKF